MPISTTNLELIIQQKLDALLASSSAQEFSTQIFLADQLNKGKVVSYPALLDFPPAASGNIGVILFAVDTQTLYFNKSGSDWSILNPTLSNVVTSNVFDVPTNNLVSTLYHRADVTLSAINDTFAPATLQTWGDNFYGQLGQGNLLHRSTPTQVGFDNTWVSVSAGPHSAAIKKNGTLWTWGLNNNGQLGIGNQITQSTLTQVGALTDWQQVESGDAHKVAIKTDGTLWIWGSDQGQGRLGLGADVNYSSPVQLGSLTDWSKISAGGAHTMAIKTDGTLWGWGWNTEGEIGVDNTDHQLVPIQVGTLTDWSQVSSGFEHTAAIKTNGTLWVWGENASGQLGLGDVIWHSSPVQVGALSEWAQVACGYQYTAAIKTDGTLWSWGWNPYGQLGLGDTDNRSSPVQVGSLTDWSAVTCGYCTGAIKTDGTLWTCGYNDTGALGLGDISNRSSPIQVGTLTTWKKIDQGIFGYGIAGITY